MRGLQSVRETGLTPVLAHPERYSCCSPAAVQAWREAGAYIQVDATTLAGTRSRVRSRGLRARELVAHGLADIMAADNHGDDRVIATGYDALVAHGAAEQAALLAAGNPGAILRDAPLAAVPPVEFKSSLLHRVREFFQPGSDG